MEPPKRIRVLSDVDALISGRAIKDFIAWRLGVRNPAESFWTSQAVIENIWPDSPFMFQIQKEIFSLPGANVSKAYHYLMEFKAAKPGKLDDLFFLRISFPGQTHDGKNPIRSRIMSPGHYDRYGGSTTSVWVPLVDTSIATGSFWWSADPAATKFHEDFPGLRTPPNYHKAFDRAGKEPMGQDALGSLHVEFCVAGEALVFGPNLFHGSTQATESERITFDFRVRH